VSEGAAQKLPEATPHGVANATPHSASTQRFKDNAEAALADRDLQNALKFVEVNFIARRREVAERLREFEALRDSARDIKDHTLAHLDLYLEAYEERLTAQGGRLHYAVTAQDARQIILDICRDVGAEIVTKGKSMVAEEIGLNDFLEGNGITPVETDLGEYIIQLRHELPSHIIAPAVHLTKDQVADTFLEHHRKLGFTRRLTERNDLVAEARYVLRQKFLDADVGLTGANFLVAETGSSMLVTNEGNADLSNTLPRMHIVLASIEKVIPTLEDAAVLLRVLARSATGQESSAYTTLNTGPRRPGDLDGPEHYHVVILDNGRSAVLGTEMQDMLRCIRCGACMNHCPVYGAIGGHAYGWVYPGPIGAVLTPQLIGVEEAGNLPNASTFCGRCESVCPVRIPLPSLMRHWREREFERHLTPRAVRQGLALWSFLARRPRLYRGLTGLANRMLALFGRAQGRYRTLPLAGGWTRFRDFPAPPPGGTFHAQWRGRRS
jgi:L-lactate dehydrogenase complex protein LldF